MPSPVLAQAELVLGAQHARRHHAADLAPLRASAPPGSVAPGRAHSTLPPGAGTLRAPHTTCVLAAAAHDVDQRQLVGPGCGRLPRTSPTTTPANVAAAPLDRLRSRGRPASARCDRVGRDAGLRSTSSRSQLNETFIRELLQETHVASRRTVAMSFTPWRASPCARCPCRTRSRCTARCRSRRAEHVGVDHAGAADLDPAGALAQLARRGRGGRCPSTGSR